MDNYISTVLNKIKDEKVKAEIQAELEDHYNERVEYYTRIGYDKETAKEKANAHFGENAEIVGEQIALINKNHKFFSCFLAIANIIVFCIPHVYLLTVFLLFGNFSTSFGPFYISLGVSVFCFVELLIALRERAWYLSCISAFNLILLSLFYKGYSPFVFCIYKALKGQLNSFVDLIYNFEWACSSKGIYAFFIAFYMFCIALSIFSMILIVKFKKCKFGKKNLKQENALKVLIITLIFLLLVCIVFVSFYPQDRDYSNLKSLDGVYVVESDEMMDPQEVSDYNHNHLYVQWSLWDDTQEAYDNNNTFVSYDLKEKETTERYDEDVIIIYTESDLLGVFQPTKKYVCVIPIYNGAAKFSEYYWVETSEEYVFESERDSTHIKYEIKVLAKEDTIGN